MEKLRIYFRKKYGKCAYCGKPLTDSGSNPSSGISHKVYKSLKNGMPSDKEITQYACFKCEMDFDNE